MATPTTVTNEILGSSVLRRAALPSSSSSSSPLYQSSFLFGSDHHHRVPLCKPRQNMSRRSSSGAASVNATIAERIGVVVRRPSMRDVVKDDRKMRRDYGPPSKVKVRATVTVRRNGKEGLAEMFAEWVDVLADMMGQKVSLELISTEIDPRTGNPKRSGAVALKDWNDMRRRRGKKSSPYSSAPGIDEKNRCSYTVDFIVDSRFGEPGAVAVTNCHRREFFLENIVVEGLQLPSSSAVHFACHSWVQAQECPDERVFFADKAYLPWETPAGLIELREKEIQALRGDGVGERKMSDRIYDYDKYNDLGNPDKGGERARPTLGGNKIPYPRRCRTGRPSTVTDPTAETRVEAPGPIYVPRDESFEQGKQKMLDEGEMKAKLHVLVPALVATSEECHDFEGFHEVNSMYKASVDRKDGLQAHLLNRLPFVGKIKETEAHLKYDTPSIITKDPYAWLRDDEFGRQTLAGINPCAIQRLQSFPPMSNLDPATYGPQESAITESHILPNLSGLTVQQALDANRLFTLDYHDAYLPFLDRINSLPGRKAYATRTIFFLTDVGTLKPVAIELRLPPGTPEHRARRVMTPPADATSAWLWQMAKAHVCSNDAGVHQLVNHWLRTHAAMEPFIIAAHRRMSAMHPVFKLMHPHMRYTLEINALARQILISGGGVIESFFTPGEVSMEMSAAAYKDGYRFDLEGLPQDLVRRGMAEKIDPEAPTVADNIRLVVEDYPYASDGLLVWSAIENWVHSYVALYYPDADSVRHDAELQGWYAEAVQVGHEDLKDAPWWPKIDTPESLASVLTTIVWLSSAQHAALNFAQYPLGGYMPNRPALMRRLIPEEGDPEYAGFLADPEKFFLSAIPSVLQATKLMTVLDTLSTHSEDEEYLGTRTGRQSYAWDADVAGAFNDFASEVRRAEEEMAKRNRDTKLRNRCGAGVLPYQLLMPSSGPGITGRGVPNSVTI